MGRTLCPITLLPSAGAKHGAILFTFSLFPYTGRPFSGSTFKLAQVIASFPPGQYSFVTSPTEVTPETVLNVPC